MSMVKELLKLISYRENLEDEGFILRENDTETIASSKAATIKKEASEVHKNKQDGINMTEPDNKKESKKNNDTYTGKSSKENKDQLSTKQRKVKKPLRPSELKQLKNLKQNQSQPDFSEKNISPSLEVNRAIISKLYSLPTNKDIVLREFTLGTTPPVQGFALFIDGLTDKAIQDMLFKTLMLLTKDKQPWNNGKTAEIIMKSMLPGNQISTNKNFRKVMDAVNFGETAFFLEDISDAITVETKGWDHRNIDRPMVEQIVRGPQEAFNETLRSNTALIRKMLKNENLITEMISVGTRNRGNVAIMYLSDLANPDLISEVKRRIDSIKTDLLTDSGMLEQFIEDHPYNLSPQVIATERPDRVTSLLVEGRVAILVDGSPYVLVVPTTMFDLLHTGEENYLRWQYGTFLRYIRTLAFYFAFLLPGTYLSIVLFHHEMIPTDLLLTIAGNKEMVPFPSVVEVLLMEFSFEMIREAGLRLPGMMGSTIGIVGALILGQAAVEANIVSPILVILVAVTGLSSFAIPNYSMSFALRIYRFFYIALGASMGFYGLTLGLTTQIFLTANMKSFGVPFLAPMGPRTVPEGDVVTRLPVFFQEKRPDYLNPQDIIRQPNVSRGWVKKREGGGNDRKE